MTLWNSSNQSEWLAALDHYWSKVKPDLEPLERKFDAGGLPERIRSMTAQEWFDFLHDEYFRWKFTAPNRLATTRAALKEHTGGLADLNRIRLAILALDLADVRTALMTAQQIGGLGPAGASGLLSILYPEHFGTVDQFVVQRLAEVPELPRAAEVAPMVGKPSLTPKQAVALIEIMRDKAKELNGRFGGNFWTPRRIDMALWGMDRR